MLPSFFFLLDACDKIFLMHANASSSCTLLLILLTHQSRKNYPIFGLLAAINIDFQLRCFASFFSLKGIEVSSKLSVQFHAKFTNVNAKFDI